MSLVLIGAGGHAKVVIDAAQCAGVDVAYVLDQDASKHGQLVLDIPIQLYAYELDLAKKYLVAIGSNVIRQKFFLELLSVGAKFATVVHPNALVSQYAEIGVGSVVFANAVINPCAKTGVNVIINTGAVIEHDCQLGDHVQVCPNATLAGTVSVGEATFIATGVVVIPNISIGKNSYIAAGAVVTKDVPDNVLVAGCPARIIKELN